MSLDLTTVLSATLKVYRRPVAENPAPCPPPNSRLRVVPMSWITGVQPQVWAATIAAKCASKLLLTHAFVDGDDIDNIGALVVVPTLAMPANGVLRCAPIEVQVVPIAC